MNERPFDRNAPGCYASKDERGDGREIAGLEGRVRKRARGLRPRLGLWRLGTCLVFDPLREASP
jgi:hypothetical protein